MYTAEQIFSVTDVTLDKRDVVLARQVVDITANLKFSVCRGQFGFGFAADMFIMAAAVILQILNSNDFHIPLLCFFKKLGSAHHGAVLTHDFTAKAAFFQPCQTAQVNSSFGMPVALEHAARA